MKFLCGKEMIKGVPKCFGKARLCVVFFSVVVVITLQRTVIEQYVEDQETLPTLHKFTTNKDFKPGMKQASKVNEKSIPLPISTDKKSEKPPPIFAEELSDLATNEEVFRPPEVGHVSFMPPPSVAAKLLPPAPPLPFVTSRESSLPSYPATVGSWQNVTGTTHKFFVFSAFYEQRGERAVRLIAATKTFGPDKVWCLLWYPGRSRVYVSAQIKAIRENWGFVYTAAFVLCPLGDEPVPQSVSVVRSRGDEPLNHLEVLQPPTPTTTDKLAVCLQPLHNYYNQTLRLIEFLELSTLLGASHFFFYNHTSSPRVDCVLRQYADSGRVTVLPWHLDLPSEQHEGIRIEGMLASMNDCLYRAMYRYSYVALVDLDEFLIPQHHDTMQQLVQALEEKSSQKFSSFSLRNAFFYLQWPDDPPQGEGDALETNLMTLMKTRRKVTLHPHGTRSKYIGRPERLIELGCHFVWESSPGYSTLHLDTTEGFSYHYRICEFGGDDCVRSGSTVDRSVRDRYRDRLLAAVAASWNQAKDVCQLPAIQRRPRQSPELSADTSFWWRS